MHTNLQNTLFRLPTHPTPHPPLPRTPRRPRCSSSFPPPPHNPTEPPPPLPPDTNPFPSPEFVSFFRQASPYIEQHRGKTFVICMPGEVVVDRALLQGALEDVALLNKLGVRLVVVLGASCDINTMLEDRGIEPAFSNGYRVTDDVTMEVVVQVAGAVLSVACAGLARAPSVNVQRRHLMGVREGQYRPTVRAVSGNYVSATRRGVVQGVDFGLTGVARAVDDVAVCQQLNAGNVVLMANLGYNAMGQVLNCNAYQLACTLTQQLGADKLICMFNSQRSGTLHLPVWLTLAKARDMLTSESTTRTPTDHVALDRWPPGPRNHQGVYACYNACTRGATRGHLLDASIEGALLLELFTRDGGPWGTMVSTDFYEGIRHATMTDLRAVLALVVPMVEDGTVVQFGEADARHAVESRSLFVVERETRLLGCARLRGLGLADGVHVAELATFCISKEYRSEGRGDSLLDYVEQEARRQGVQRLVVMTTRTAEYFLRRQFEPAGVAHESPYIPDSRRQLINPARGSQLYIKSLEPGEMDPGQRIGF